MDKPKCRICGKKHYGLCDGIGMVVGQKPHNLDKVPKRKKGSLLPDKYVAAAHEHDLSEIERLKDYLRVLDPKGEVEFAGKSVTDWAIANLDRLQRRKKYQRDYMRKKRSKK